VGQPSAHYRFEARLSGHSSGRLGSLAGVGGRFIGGDRDRVFLMPPTLRDWVPEGHLVWTVLDTVGELDLSAIMRGTATPGAAGRRMSRR
jgi:hypothetical protein